MKQTLLAVVLMMVAGGAFANGGLSIDTVNKTNVNLSTAEIDRSALAQGSIEKFEAYKGQMVIVDSEALRHGSNA